MKKYIIFSFLILSLFSYSKTFYGSHLTSTYPWVNKIVVFNCNNKVESFKLIIKDSDGLQTFNKDYEIESLKKTTFVLTNYSEYQLTNDEISLNPVEGSFTIETESESIVPLLSFQFGSSDSVSQFLLSSNLNKSYILPNNSLDSFSWSGIGIMNNSTDSLSISINLYKNKNIIDTKSISINGNSKYVDLISNLFQGIEKEDYSQIIITSENDFPAPILITGNEIQDRHLFFSGKPITLESSNLKEYNLFTPLNSTKTYLMDNDFNIVHTWNSDTTPGNSVYLLDDLSIMRTGSAKNNIFQAGGSGGKVQKISYDDEILWDFSFSSDEYLQHHDIEVLPNGNVLFIAWIKISKNEAINNGRNPDLATNAGVWIDSVVEVKPTGFNSGEIVWQWKLSDHLIQDYDSSKTNYGVIKENPGLIDFNFTNSSNSDYTHINSIDYNEKLDQILLSVHNFSEIWIIDHSTTTEEAKSHTGGIYGKGGDLLYRWGNPAAYGSGDKYDQKLFVQHDAEWIPEGYPGASHILVFNNGGGRIDGNYSSIEEIIPPLKEDGSYEFTADSTYLPENSYWTYTDEIKTDFYAKNISGSQRLKNGNTLICDGPAGHFFEINENNEVVWEYFANSQVFRVDRYYLSIGNNN